MIIKSYDSVKNQIEYITVILMSNRMLTINIEAQWKFKKLNSIVQDSDTYHLRYSLQLLLLHLEKDIIES